MLVEARVAMAIAILGIEHLLKMCEKKMTLIKLQCYSLLQKFAKHLEYT
jgi:hypothetical protein